jgi:histidine triad (HIT) family protein
MTRNSDCVFCKIVSVEIPASVVYEDESLICFLDHNPLSPGHLLIVTREHYVKLTELPSDVSSKVGSVLPLAGRALLEVTGAKGFNVLCNEGAVAGQLVQHVHFHLIPRFEGDKLGYRWVAGSYEEGKAAQLTDAFQQAFTASS